MIRYKRLNSEEFCVGVISTLTITYVNLILNFPPRNLERTLSSLYENI